MIHSSTDLVKLNVFNTSLDSIKEYTIVKTRPDLKLNCRRTVNVFSPYEKEHKDSWKLEDFDYSLSELGFRDDDLNSDVIDLAAFGCSFTFGQALPLDRLWHKIIAKKRNINSYNFGQPGASVKAIADMFCIISNNVKIKKAVFLIPNFARQLIATTNIVHKNIFLLPLMPNYKGKLQELSVVDTDDFYKTVPNEDLIKNFKDCLYLIDYIAKLKNIEIYFSSWDHTTYNMLSDMNFSYAKIIPEWISKDDHKLVDYKLDLARDKLHPGIQHHILFASKIEEHIFP